MSCDTDSTTPDLDETFELLAVRRRRAAIRYLRENAPARFGELVDAVADGDEQGAQTVRISLYQSHVPTLVDHGVVEWDGDGDGWVSRGPQFERVDGRLQRCTSTSLTERLRRAV